MNNLKKKIASYNKCRKGVLMLMPLEFILLVIVFCLFIITFIITLTSTKGPSALSTLKKYLGRLQLRLNQSSILDAEEERSGIETIFNDVKASCHQLAISEDTDLKILLRQVYAQMSTLTNSHTDNTKTSWIKLKAVTQGFGELYFTDFAK
jgi:hypothetical protein